MPLHISEKSVRKLDNNGFAEIKGNPLTKVGVFPYYGRQIHASLDPDKIYQVYRPEEELRDQACIDSFKLVPWTDDHAMLGSEEEGLTPAEKKGVHGVIGQDVYFEDGYLKGNLKIYSEKMARAIDSGKKELSIGYHVLYELENGVYNGQKYDAVQRQIRGNHVALVQEGRAGRDVRVLDSTLALDCDILPLDSKELYPMTKQALDDNATTVTETPAAETKSDMQMMADKLDSLTETVSGIVTKLKDWDDAKPDVANDEKKKSGMDAANASSLTFKAIAQDLALRNDLYNRLSQHIGSFVHDAMDVNEIAQYGVKKLELACNAGDELPVLNGYLQGVRKAEMVVIDSGLPAMKQLDAYFSGSN